jgi:hypothetical protein
LNRFLQGLPSSDWQKYTSDPLVYRSVASQRTNDFIQQLQGIVDNSQIETATSIRNIKQAYLTIFSDPYFIYEAMTAFVFAAIDESCFKFMAAMFTVLLIHQKDKDLSAKSDPRIIKLATIINIGIEYKHKGLSSIAYISTQEEGVISGPDAKSLDSAILYLGHFGSSCVYEWAIRTKRPINVAYGQYPLEIIPAHGFAETLSAILWHDLSWLEEGYVMSRWYFVLIAA